MMVPEDVKWIVAEWIKQTRRAIDTNGWALFWPAWILIGPAMFFLTFGENKAPSIFIAFAMEFLGTLTVASDLISRLKKYSGASFFEQMKRALAPAFSIPKRQDIQADVVSTFGFSGQATASSSATGALSTAPGESFHSVIQYIKEMEKKIDYQEIEISRLRRSIQEIDSNLSEHRDSIQQSLEAAAKRVDTELRGAMSEGIHVLLFGITSVLIGMLLDALV